MFDPILYMFHKLNFGLMVFGLLLEFLLEFAKLVEPGLHGCDLFLGGVDLVPEVVIFF